jgi:hypothetical protein
MDVRFAAGYRVPPGADLNEEDAARAVEGSEVELGGALSRRIGDLVKAAAKLPIEIDFRSDDQTNPVRDAIIRIARVRQAESAARELAGRLSSATDRRSRLGLLLIVVAAEGDERAVHLWRFGAQQDLIAQFRGGHLAVEVLAEAFGSESVLFKAARFSGRIDADRSFWKGRAEDRQAKLPGAAASAYWIDRFLAARLAVSPGAGTQVLAEAVAKVIRRSHEPDTQARLVAGALSLFNAVGDRVSYGDLLQRLPPNVRRDVLREIEKASFTAETTFVLEEQTLQRSLGLRELRLDTGVIVAGPNQRFDQLVRTRAAPRNRVELSTTGAIVATRVKAGRRAG